MTNKVELKEMVANGLNDLGIDFEVAEELASEYVSNLQESMIDDADRVYVETAKKNIFDTEDYSNVIMTNEAEGIDGGLESVVDDRTIDTDKGVIYLTLTFDV